MTISAKVIQDSISQAGIRITTLELEYPRFIHSEFMTHRQFSRNSASSRAIPIERMLAHVKDNPAMPIHWGKNQPGMQASEEVKHQMFAREQWTAAANSAALSADALRMAGLHKQIVNRVIEPFQTIKVVVTATEWDNFFHLRADPAAQPEIHALALKMMEAMAASEPMPLLREGEWHVPYVNRERVNSRLVYSVGDEILSAYNARQVSASCCAQVSYRKLDQSLDKAIDICERLVASEPIHASPFEHQATPFKVHKLHNPSIDGWPPGATHVDSMFQLWSANFRGWAQFRKYIERKHRGIHSA